MSIYRIQTDDSLAHDSADTLADSIRRQLADDILDGQFSINHRLDEQEIADRFDVSRTPVREALRQLASAGLVEIKPRRGAIVVAVEPSKIGQSFEAAAELEGLAAGWAAARASMVEMVQLTEAFEACDQALGVDDADAFATANRNFHDTIANLAKNESLTAATRLVRVQTAPFQRVRFHLEDERRMSQSEHAEILKAVCQQDSDAAKRAMKNHILRASLSALRSWPGEGDKQP